ncbi:MAG TPA: tetratricopeptide repeat protein, partial [Fibrobacteria bacterium]|nr:tetratricopeptide repeat protein [Fibrobacteria bacterium]
MDNALEPDPMDRIHELEQAVQENPFDEDPAIELGRTYLARNRYHEAVDVLENLKSLNPGASELYPLLGISYLNVDRAREALDNLRIAVSHNPEEGY